MRWLIRHKIVLGLVLGWLAMLYGAGASSDYFYLAAVPLTIGSILAIPALRRWRPWRTRHWWKVVLLFIGLTILGLVVSPSDWYFAPVVGLGAAAAVTVAVAVLPFWTLSGVVERVFGHRHLLGIPGVHRYLAFAVMASALIVVTESFFVFKLIQWSVVRVRRKLARQPADVD